MIKILIYGEKGYIGSLLKEYLLKESNIQILSSLFPKIKDEQQIEKDIEILKPNRIISCIGLTNTKTDNSTLFLNKDSYLPKNLENNLYIHILLANVCINNNIHFTYIGTGCIYNSFDSNFIFSENAKPNYIDNNYGLVKGYTDKILSLNQNKILILRLRQCINNDLHSRNFLNKFLKLKKVSILPNSFTIVPSIFPIIIKLILDRIVGIYNAVNKNSISVKEIVDIYEKSDYEIADSKFIQKKYANNILSTKKLEEKFIVEDVKSAIIKMKNKT